MNSGGLKARRIEEDSGLRAFVCAYFIGLFGYLVMFTLILVYLDG